MAVWAVMVGLVAMEESAGRAVMFRIPLSLVLMAVMAAMRAAPVMAVVALVEMVDPVLAFCLVQVPQ
jgi:hypothetical protein